MKLLTLIDEINRLLDEKYKTGACRLSRSSLVLSR